jgi:hypothetical protein
MLIISFDIGIKNLAYCIMDSINVNIIEAELVDLKCKKGNIQNIIDATLELLDDIFSKLDTTQKIHVIIESQMTSLMKAIQTVINVFFKMYKKYESLDIETKYISARNKLSLINKYKDEYVQDDNIQSNQYKQNKVDSIHFGTWLLIHKYPHPELLNKIKTLKKKDDIFDTILMCIYYYQENFVFK